ncbi:LysR family transcriptional regulator [Chimaeribacter californicus]|uniref:LysR family transcriptional regulator n=1 Tax=Chimaeribacter californicus TaxID=2060067 RepID=A0A2N5DYI1_9GAMM|nr:LysR family transcriptional regulator [Chimaeribacter californicus]PLR32612.1 LysR family transcriptional regulator [Chimaeribacter californicus]
MDRLDAMQVFIRVVELRSFTKAAALLGLPRSTVTDAVRQLEARLGVKLLARTTRHVSPTPDGDAYYLRCLNILAEVEDAEGAFAGGTPKGVLRVDVQGTLARHFMLPALGDFLAAYPGIELQLSESDRRVDALREGIDCVLRVGPVHTSDLVARPLGVLEEITCASPAYLARFGTPHSPADLAGHLMVGFRTEEGTVLPLAFTQDGRATTVTLPCRVSVNGVESFVEAALQGFGLLQAPYYSLGPALASGQLVPVLEAFAPGTPLPVTLLYPQNRRHAGRVRVFIEWLSQEFEARNRRGAYRKPS